MVFYERLVSLKKKIIPFERKNDEDINCDEIFERSEIFEGNKRSRNRDGNRLGMMEWLRLEGVGAIYPEDALRRLSLDITSPRFFRKTRASW